MTVDWQAILDRKVAMLESCYDAMSAIMLRGAQSYTVDTGQTRMVVQRVEVGNLRLLIRELEDSISTLDARLGGTSAAIARPAEIAGYI